MDDLYLKAIVSVAALYAAANPWFRHHNTSDPIDLLTALSLFTFFLFAIGDLPIATALWVSAGFIAADLGAHLLCFVLKRKAFVVFGGGKRHFDAVHGLILTLAETNKIPAEVIEHTKRRPWLVVFRNLPGKLTGRFNKAFDKELRPLLGLELWRLYPATIAVLAFLAAVWRYM